VTIYCIIFIGTAVIIIIFNLCLTLLVLIVKAKRLDLSYEVLVSPLSQNKLMACLFL
jgi:hypothetical protein